MNAKDLKWFQEVCRCKSMTKAAANLYISPQGLSKAEVLLQELKQLTQELERGNFDVGFRIEGPKLDGFCSIPLFTSSISLLVYEGHPLAKKECVKVEDLDGEPMIIESRAFQIHQMFRKLCMSKGVKPDIIFNTSGFSLCHKLCRQKKGLSIVVDRISQDMNDSHLRKIPFETPLVWKAAMVYKKKFAQNGLIRTFHEYTMDYLREQGIS